MASIDAIRRYFQSVKVDYLKKTNIVAVCYINMDLLFLDDIQ